jgi:hypothetical protein
MMKRTFKSTNGREIWVESIARDTKINSQFLVHLMGRGYVIAFWAPHLEGPQLEPVGSRITEEDVDADTMMAALEYGQKLADLIQSSDEVRNSLSEDGK